MVDMIGLLDRELPKAQRKAFEVRIVCAEIVSLTRSLRTAEMEHAKAIVLFFKRKKHSHPNQHQALMHEWSHHNDELLATVTKVQDKIDAALDRLDTLLTEVTA